jgi:hypothetical protein
MTTSCGSVIQNRVSVPFFNPGIGAGEGTEISCLHAEQIAALRH